MHLFQGSRRKYIWITAISVVVLAALLLPRLFGGTPLHAITGEALDGNWTSSTWAPANNTMVGTSANLVSNVWFTGHNGILGSIFYPSVDMPNTSSLEFLVGDSNHTWVDEEQKDTIAQTQLYDKRSLAWVTTNTAKNKRYQIKKIIYTDPDRNSVIQQVTFTALQGTLDDYLLYAYYDPTIHNSGDKNSSMTKLYNGRTVLVSTDASGDYASALAADIPFQPDMTSSGFVGFNDGLTDLKGQTNCGNPKCPDYVMNYEYQSAMRGNTAQMGLLDLSNEYEKDVKTEKSITFNLVLSFGQNTGSTSGSTIAEMVLDGTLNTLDAKETQGATLKTYISLWNAYDNKLTPPPAVGKTPDVQQARQQEYYLAANVLKASQDKQTGAIVAGLGKPWGEYKGDDDVAGYHMVWQRDLYEVASAMIVAGDTLDPQRALQWSFNTQQQPDGHFPQNSDTSGTPYWTGLQMDEQAFPIMLAWKLSVTDNENYTKHIKPAANYIVAHGPSTGQERWEENAGYSPATIATEIAGLLCAADIARVNKDSASEKRFQDAADTYQSNVVKWTYTTTGTYGNGHYFERIAADGNPNNGSLITIANHGGTYDEREIVDPSFLELVRQGILPAKSPYITSSLTVIDAQIKQTINGYPYWFRYNHDGYGEHDDGFPFDGSGKGRLWPLLSGERGVYEVAAGADAEPYLSAMMAAANSSGMIPEQVWDNKPPAVDSPYCVLAPCAAGTPTKSMNPLNWAMGEYITLLVSASQHDIADGIKLTTNRYVNHSTKNQTP